MANPPNGSSILPPDPVIPAHYNILLIEEDPNQKVIYSQMIREIVECKIDVMSGISANTFDYIGRSNYHLVVIDEPSGLSHLETIKRMSPSTAVILVSQGATVEQAVAAIKLGAEDYFKKPFNMDAFQLAVKRGLDRKAIFGQDSDASSFLYLLNSCQLISSALDQSKIFEIVQSYLKRELNAAYSGIYTCHQGEVLREDPLAKEGSQERAMQEVLDIALRATNPMQGMMDDNEFVRFIERGTLTPGYFIMRFRCAGSVDYFCVCLSPARPASLDAFEGRLRMLRAQIEVTGKNIEQYLGVQQLVYVDDATGLYNTRYLNYILDREIAQTEATGRSFAVLFIDADKFKGVNDAHGHLVGTKLLNELGIQLKRLVRGSDTVFRYGGDEFVAVLSPCDLVTAKMVAERIRASVEALPFLEAEGLNLHFTVSIGVALFPDHARQKKDVIEAADAAMYSSKKRSRNSVTIAEARPVAVALKGAAKGKGTKHG